MNHRVITAICALLSCLQATFAQGTELIQIDFTAYGLRPADYSNIYYQDARGEPVKLRFFRKQRSASHKAMLQKDDPTLTFLRQAEPGAQNDTAGYRKIAETPLTRETGPLLFVFVPDQAVGQEGPFRVLPIEDPRSRAQGGTLRVVNLTGSTLFGLAGNERIQLPRFSCSRPLGAESEEGLPLSFASKRSSRLHLVYRNRFLIDSGDRAILFLTPPYRRVSLKLGGHMLYETLNGGAE